MWLWGCVFGAICMKLVLSSCENSYFMACDSVQDLLDMSLATKLSWTELLISGDFPQHTLTKNHTEGLYNLEILVINKQLVGIDVNAFSDDNFSKKVIAAQVIFFANNIATIKSDTFFGVSFGKLSLRGNGITNIEMFAFNTLEVTESIDLSHNNLITLQKATFAWCTIKILNLRHNKLSNIEEEALPQGLKFIYLDHNNFHIFSTTHLPELQKLKKLSINHNKLTHIGDISQLASLQILDMSFNNLQIISNELNSLTQLRVINFEGNNLVKFSFPTFLHRRQKETYVFLANNRLSNVNVPAKHITLTLSGNPWSCLCFDAMMKVISSPNSTVSVLSSDQQFIKAGQVPYCIVHSSFEQKCLESQVTEEDFHLFRNLTVRDPSCDDYIATAMYADFDKPQKTKNNH